MTTNDGEADDSENDSDKMHISERLNASRNKQAGDEDAEKQKKSCCFSPMPCYKWVEQKKILRANC